MDKTNRIMKTIYVNKSELKQKLQMTTFAQRDELIMYFKAIYLGDVWRILFYARCGTKTV